MNGNYIKFGAMIDDIAAHGKAMTAEEAQARPVPDFQGERHADRTAARGP